MNKPVLVGSVEHTAQQLVDKIEEHRATIKFREPGIYFSLAENEYHADGALGSSDVKKLAYSPPDYWFSSLDPHREAEEESPAKFFGKAAHKIILEGRSAFEANYSPCDWPGNIKAGKAERAIIEEARKIPLRRADWDRIQKAGAMIQGNPHLREAFANGCPEVSIFWNSDGIPKKCRIDYLKLRASVDLKSIRNTREVEFVTACRRAVGTYGYHTQAAHYYEGRQHMSELVLAGAVHGAHDSVWLCKAATQKEWAHVIVFYQAEGAPLTKGFSISPGNGILDLAKATIARAEANYREFRDRFGVGTPWITQEPMEELALEEMPAWFGRE